MKTIAKQSNQKGLNTEQVISSFFSMYPQGRTKALLWCWFRLTVSGTFCKLATEEQEDFARFFDALQDLFTVYQPDMQKGEPAP